jgi:acetyltransferase
MRHRHCRKTSPDDTSARTTAEQIIGAARSEGRELLTEYESKQLLAAYGIPTVETRIATTAQSRAVRRMNWLSGCVETALAHQYAQDGGGGVLPESAGCGCGAEALLNPSSTRCARKQALPIFRAYTVQPMAKLDGYENPSSAAVWMRQFGPGLLFGSGGQLVEV